MSTPGGDVVPGLERAGNAHPDDALLRAFVAGERAATRRVERWAWEIVYFRWGSVPPDERADLIQDALSDVWRVVSRPGFALRTNLRALVRRVAAARCVDWLRRRRPMATLSPQLAGSAPGPYDQWLWRNERARLRWALQTLDERCRDIIREHFFEGLAYAAIAARRQLSESTMRVHMFNCMKTVRKLWKRGVG